MGRRVLVVGGNRININPVSEDGLGIGSGGHGRTRAIDPPGKMSVFPNGVGDKAKRVVP